MAERSCSHIISGPLVDVLELVQPYPCVSYFPGCVVCLSFNGILVFKFEALIELYVSYPLYLEKYLLLTWLNSGVPLHFVEKNAATSVSWLPLILNSAHEIYHFVCVSSNQDMLLNKTCECMQLYGKHFFIMKLQTLKLKSICVPFMKIRSIARMDLIDACVRNNFTLDTILAIRSASSLGIAKTESTRAMW